MTPEHLAAMREGKARSDERRREERQAKIAAFAAWSKTDAHLWRAVHEAEETFGRDHPRSTDLRAAYRVNRRAMPDVS